MKKDFILSDIIINDKNPPLVIPEIGINHNGSLKIAKEMVDSAKKAGARLIKHQTHIVEDEMSKEAKRVIPGNAKISIYEIMEKCALNEQDEYELMQYTQKKDMLYLSTPFSRAAALRLESFGVKAYKIGSGECNNYPLLELIASFKKPTILSTGMNDIKSVKKAVEIFQKQKTPLALLHTTNLYPTPPHLVRLGAMSELMREFANLQVGLSDHTTSNLACFAAVGLGANILERHFTDTKARIGPDIINSMDEKELEELIKGSYEIAQMRGGKKEATKEEKVTIDFAFATVVSIKAIKKGEALTKENIWVKRPGTGEIKAENFDKILSKIATKDIANDTHLTWNDFE